MKKLLFILFLFPLLSQGQITIGHTNTVTVSSSSASTQVRPSTDFTSGRLYLLFVSNAKATSPEEATVTGTSQTWTKIDGLTFNTIGTPTQRVTVYRFLAASTFSATTSISFGATQLSISSHIYQINGMVTTGTNGSDAIVQAVTNSADATANPSVTMAAISNGRNAVVSYFGNDINPFGGTVEAGWTQEFNVGYASPDRGDYSMYRLTTTDNTPTVTAASSDWAGIAIEIKSAARRRIIID
jgi:hypothetical protein